LTKLLREFPPNPTLVNYHTRDQLTTLMSERYRPGQETYPRPWITSLGAVSHLRAIHIMRHKLRLKKQEEAEWSGILARVEDILTHAWDIQGIESVERRAIRHEFPLPKELSFERRTVYEGVDHSREHPLAARLFDIPGITTLVFYRETVTIKRGLCFPWTELVPKIGRVLKEYAG